MEHILAAVTRARVEGFKLEDAVRAPGFTPRAGDVDALVGLALGADETLADAAALALGRLEATPIDDALGRGFDGGDERARVVAVALWGKLGGALAWLSARLDDPSARVRKAAAQAIGRLGSGGTAAEQALITRLGAVGRGERELPEVRAIVEALSKVGGAAGARALDGLDDAGDKELARILERARLRLGRERSSTAAPEVLDPQRRVSATLVLGTRNGIEPLLIEELGRGAPAPGGVGFKFTGPLAELLKVRSWQGLWFPLGKAKETPEDVARLVASTTPRLLEALGPAPWRYRLAWADGRHRRAATIAHVVALQKAEPRLANDPAGAPWELRLTIVRGAVELALVARGLVDDRWAWRSGDVPAASHPPLAAAMAYVAGVRPDEIVWDPFCGSGLELAERWLRGPAARLVGTDTDARALAVARTNLIAAGVDPSRLVLREADASTYMIGDVGLIITNPPMGRRVHRGDVGPLLERLVQRAAEVLSPTGRLVWVSPVPDRTLAAAKVVKLRCTLRQRVDMGGFSSELQRFERPRA